MKKSILLLLAIMAALGMKAQSLEKMQWFNEPEKWEIKGNRLSMFVTPQTDYWRVSHYGFTVDDPPFLYTLRGGEFEVKVKISADYRTRFDQSGLMLRIDAENWLKAGIEYYDGRYNISTVVTHGTSDWSILPMDKAVDAVWIKAVRRKDAVEIFYSLDDKDYTMLRNAWMADKCPMMVGMMAACPDGPGFEAVFSDFKITHLPDLRRLQWLDANKDE